MTKMIFIDDDEILRRAVSQTVGWAAHGIELVGVARDSVEGLEMIAKLQPSVVVTDIRMPCISGIELCQILNREYPWIKVILLSGHEQFQYAQQAISYKVFAYLTKPVHNQQLLKTVLKAGGECQQEEARRKLLAQGNPLLLDKAFLGIFSHSIPMEHAHSLLSLLRVPVWTHCIAGIFRVDAGDDSYDRLCYSVSSAVECLRGEASPCREQVLVDLGNVRFAMVWFTCEKNEEQLKQEARAAAQQLCDRLLDEYGFHACAILGNPHGPGGEEMRLSYQEAADPVMWSQSLPLSGVLFASDFAWADTGKRRQKAELLSLSLESLTSSLFDTSADWRTKLSHSLQAVRENVDSVRSLQVELIRFLDELHQRSIHAGHLSELEEDEIYILSQTQLQPILSRVERHCAHFRQELDSLRRSRSHMLIDQAVRYLEKHYDDPELSLGVLADHVGVSPTYLSGLFTSERGENFQHCLLQMRMEAAKALLKRDTLKGYEIAEKVGFSNPYYFGACFKKFTGYTPTEYRKDSGADAFAAPGRSRPGEAE